MSVYTLATIFNDDSIQQSLGLFPQATLDTIENAIFDKNGKPAIKCLVTGKDRPAKFEFLTRTNAV